jgi:hypothetical protein
MNRGPCPYEGVFRRVMVKWGLSPPSPVSAMEKMIRRLYNREAIEEAVEKGSAVRRYLNGKH